MPLEKIGGRPIASGELVRSVPLLNTRTPVAFIVESIVTTEPSGHAARSVICSLAGDTDVLASAPLDRSTSRSCPDAVAKFGQEAIKPPAGAPPALKQVESRIRGKFQGWGPNKRIELENGQVWRIADDSEALYELQDPKVIVHRGLFGAYFLEIEGVPFQVRVVRAR